MTKRKDTATKAKGKKSVDVLQGAALNAFRARVERDIDRNRIPYAVDMLQRLTAEELMEVVLDELKRRESEGVPKGLFLGAVVTVRRLLGLQMHKDDAAKADRIAAVARGVHIRSTKEPSVAVREIGEWIDAVASLGRTRGLTLDEQALRLAKAIADESEYQVTAEQAREALSHKAHSGRVAAIARSLGLYGKKSEREILNAVRAALRQP